MAFDKWKQMVFPRRVLVGHRVLSQLGDLVRDLKLEPRALIVDDETTKRIAGDEAAQILEKAGHAATHCLIRGATMESVNAAKAAAKSAKAGYLIGAGGGSVIDVAKLAA